MNDVLTVSCSQVAAICFYQTAAHVSHSSHFHLEDEFVFRCSRFCPIDSCEYKQLSLKSADQSMKSKSCECDFRFANFYLWCLIKLMKRFICPYLISGVCMTSGQSHLITSRLKLLIRDNRSLTLAKAC